jgi:hypothetical protein
MYFESSPVVPSSPSENPLWSPSSSSETSAKTDTSLSPDVWSNGRYFSFKETELDLVNGETMNARYGHQEDSASTEPHDAWSSSSDHLSAGSTQLQSLPTFDQMDNIGYHPDKSEAFFNQWSALMMMNNGTKLEHEASLSPSGNSYSSDSMSPLGSSLSEEDQPWSPSPSLPCHRRSLSLSSSCSDEDLRDVRCMWIDCKAGFDNQVRNGVK